LLAVAELVAAALDEAAEALAPLDDESVDELEEAVDELEVDEGLAAVGRKVSLPTPKPIAAASAPLPPTKIELLSPRLVMTSWPLALSEAVTFALVGRSTLMALIRSPMVSVPVDV